jgi:transposase
MRENVSMSKRKRRTFTEAQKADAVRLVRQVGSISQIARDLDLTETSLRAWVRKAEIESATESNEPATADEKEELKRLRRQVRTLQMERDFLRRAAAFFARGQEQPSN